MESDMAMEVYLESVRHRTYDSLFEVYSQDWRPAWCFLHIAHSIFTQQQDLVCEYNCQDRLEI